MRTLRDVMFAVILVAFISIFEVEADVTWHDHVEQKNICEKAKQKLQQFIDCQLSTLNVLDTGLCSFGVADIVWDTDPTSSVNTAITDKIGKWNTFGSNGVSFVCGTVTYKFLSLTVACASIDFHNTIQYKFNMGDCKFFTDAPSSTWSN
jgi:hypothetical protein